MNEGRYEAARGFFDSAMAMHERMKAHTWVAHTQVEQAELCARSGELERALGLASGAEERARSLGMHRLAARSASIAERVS